jgi:hypothetical protein
MELVPNIGTRFICNPIEFSYLFHLLLFRDSCFVFCRDAMHGLYIVMCPIYLHLFYQ